MPLERRVQLPRTLQKKGRGNLRLQTYRITSSLHDSRTQDHSQSRITREDEQVSVPFKPAVKRAGYGVCTCISRDEPMHTDETHPGPSLGDEVAEAQRLSVDQRTQTALSQRTWQMEGSSLRFQHVTHSSHTISSPERDVSTDPSTSSIESSTYTDRLIPSTNSVPNMPTSPCSRTYTPNFTNLDHSPTEDVYNPRSLISPSNNLPAINNLCELSPLDGAVRKRSTWRTQDSISLSSLLRVSRGSKADMPPATAHARQVANRIIKHARDNKTPDEQSLWCPDCRRLPVLPVTGICGHTRCTSCIEDHGDCPCGVQAPKTLHVNTLIQDLTKKMLSSHSVDGCARSALEGPTRIKRQPDQSLLPGKSRARKRCADVLDVPPQTIMSPKTRFEHAWKLVQSGRCKEAAPHFARVAASANPLAKAARTALAQIITLMSDGRDPRRLTRSLYRAVRAQSASSWLQPSDMECVLCYHPYIYPVATPCGHTYCRTCIERSMDYRKSCALCLRSLDDFDLSATRETEFVCAALASIDALNPPPPPDPDVIPIFVCTVAYPAIPCPLFIFDPRYWLMIRRVLESGSRKFGMVAYEREASRSYSDYGTVLEVRDCVHLEDGRSILSTVGVSRFRVIKRDVRDGCDVARIQPLTDITPTEELVIWELRLMATQISYKALLWLNSMNQSVRGEIEAAFGWLPRVDSCQEWWLTPDGPAWLWWLIAILPLRAEIKILILSTKNLLKRMMAVSRTLEAIEQVAISATSSSECELRSALTQEEWI